MKNFKELFEEIMSKSGREVSDSERTRDKTRRSIGIRVTKGSRGNVQDLLKSGRKKSIKGKSVHKRKKNVFKKR